MDPILQAGVQGVRLGDEPKRESQHAHREHPVRGGRVRLGDGPRWEPQVGLVTAAYDGLGSAPR